MSHPPEVHHDPAKLLEDVWAQLGRALVEPGQQWQLPVFSNIGQDGRPESRTLVLRSADHDRRILTCHTDRRSPKVPALAANPAISMVFYDRKSRTQLRVNGTARVHADDEIAREGWANTKLSSRRCYLAPYGPSEECEEWVANLPDDLHHSAPEAEQSEAGWENFAVIRINVTEMERLDLHHDGHVRCRWRWNDGSDEPVAAWLAP